MKKLTATICLTIAVLLGNVEVSWSADFDKGLAALRSGDYATALREFETLSEQGHANAQYNLGLMYGYGEGVTLDFAYAYMWWDIAASSGKHKKASKNREIAAKKMSPSQIKKAQGLVRDCIRKKYKGC